MKSFAEEIKLRLEENKRVNLYEKKQAKVLISSKISFMKIFVCYLMM